MPPPLADKLGQLGRYVEQLRRLLALSPEPALRESVERALERMIQVLVDCGADAGELWLTAHGAPAPDTAAAVFRELGEAGAIPEELVDRFRRHVTARNRVVHNYAGVTAAGTHRDAEQLADDAAELLRCLLAA